MSGTNKKDISENHTNKYLYIEDKHVGKQLGPHNTIQNKT